MGHTNLIHTGLKAHLMLCAIMADLQDLFSRKHRFPFFAKVARISPRYKMQFFGCLHCKDPDLHIMTSLHLYTATE